MDLTSFTKKEIINDKKEIIIENDDVKITKIGSKTQYFFKTQKGFDEYQDKLFLSKTKEIISNDVNELTNFFKQSIDDGVEGLMIKNLNSTYKPGLRTGAMAKLKEVKEDVDLVIVAAEYGKGKRAGFFSSFYVAAKTDDNNEEYLVVGKVSSGIKELGNEGATLEKLSELLLPLKIEEKKNVVYFEPKIIIEVRYQEIQKSPTYDSGIALRFPRIINLREDKNLEEINSITELERFGGIN